MVVSETSGDDPALADALAGAGLPVDDLMEPGRRFFVFRLPDGDPLGYAGAETADSVALLRSLVVAKHRRGQGNGQRMTKWMLAWLADHGVHDVYLLTMTATHLAERCGFVRIDRGDAPEAIRNSTQFSALCPSTAVLMVHKGGLL